MPTDKEKDTQLKYGLDLLRGIKSVDTDAKKKAEVESATPEATRNSLRAKSIWIELRFRSKSWSLTHNRPKSLQLLGIML